MKMYRPNIIKSGNEVIQNGKRPTGNRHLLDHAIAVRRVTLTVTKFFLVIRLENGDF